VDVVTLYLVGDELGIGAHGLVATFTDDDGRACTLGEGVAKEGHRIGIGLITSYEHDALRGFHYLLAPGDLLRSG
jgi:hypothetical protein